MKARYLKSLLNDTGYTVGNYGEYIAVGSPLCHDLIKVDKTTLRVTYALDTWNNGRVSLMRKDDTDLLFIWDKLHELIASGEIHDIIAGRDVIENPLPVFTVVGGTLIESVTDAYGWPHPDDDGVIQYNDTHFPTREEAIEQGIKEARAGIKSYLRSIAEAEQKLQALQEGLTKDRADLAALEAMLTDCPALTPLKAVSALTQPLTP